jgi:hypothetical protein
MTTGSRAPPRTIVAVPSNGSNPHGRSMAYYLDYFIRLLSRTARSAVPRRTVRTATPAPPEENIRTAGAVQRLHRAFRSGAWTGGCSTRVARALVAGGNGRAGRCFERSDAGADRAVQAGAPSGEHAVAAEPARASRWRSPRRRFSAVRIATTPPSAPPRSGVGIRVSCAASLAAVALICPSSMAGSGWQQCLSPDPCQVPSGSRWSDGLIDSRPDC